MKKNLTIIIAILLAVPTFAAQYYVAGNGTSGNPWCGGQSWKQTGSAMTMNGTTGSITFNNVPAGAYQFKVTSGSSWLGWEKFSATCSNLYAYANGDKNICFNTTATQDITVTYDGSSICLTGSVGNDYPDPTQFGKYGVPPEYEGVMMQVFYWNSYTDKGYGRTKWVDLCNNYIDAIGDNFDLVWFPPSGNGGGTGYYTKTYSNQNTDWGTPGKLQELINGLHAKGTKVLGDIVINHRQASSGWCGFSNENFGSYGSFQLTSEHICSGDECFTKSDSNCKNAQGGAPDTGTNDEGCRDLDHTNTYVQDFVKAYLSWMKSVMGYDGWRYDMVKGYLGTYLSMYNQSSQPFFSVAEYWDDLTSIAAYLETAEYNTTAFDFPLKFTLNSSLGKGSCSGLKNAGLRSRGLQKYAVTFIDNHDTFEREDGQSHEYIGYNKSLTANKERIMQANAYLLMMPGTPCVFWPHWVTFTEEINTLIALRKAAGLHSESAVSDETASGTAYSATITGHKGSVVLRIGKTRDTSVPAGYFRAIKGNNYEIYASNGVQFTEKNISGFEALGAEHQHDAVKQVINGKIYILRDGHRYDVTGRMVE